VKLLTRTSVGRTTVALPPYVAVWKTRYPLLMVIVVMMTMIL